MKPTDVIFKFESGYQRVSWEDDDSCDLLNFSACLCTRLNLQPSVYCLQTLSCTDYDCSKFYFVSLVRFCEESFSALTTTTDSVTCSGTSFGIYIFCSACVENGCTGLNFTGVNSGVCAFIRPWICISWKCAYACSYSSDRCYIGCASSRKVFCILRFNAYFLRCSLRAWFFRLAMGGSRHRDGVALTVTCDWFILRYLRLYLL